MGEPADAKAEIPRFKDRGTALAYKVEEAVDMSSGAIVAATTHAGAAPDTETICEPVVAAGEQVAELIAVVTADGEAPVAPQGVSEVVADKGRHSHEVLWEREQMGVRSYIAEPQRRPRRWVGRAAEQRAV